MQFFQLNKNFKLKNQYKKFDELNFTLGETTSKIQKIYSRKQFFHIQKPKSKKKLEKNKKSNNEERKLGIETG